MGRGNVFMRIVKCRQFPSSRSETEGLWTNKELTLSVHLQWEAQQSWYVNAWHKGVIFIKSVFIDFLYSQDMTSSCTCIFIHPSSQASSFISASLMLRNAHKTQNSFKPSWDTPTHFRQLWNTEFSFHLQCWVSYLWKNVSNDWILMKIVSNMKKWFLPTFNQCSSVLCQLIWIIIMRINLVFSVRNVNWRQFRQLWGSNPPGILHWEHHHCPVWPTTPGGLGSGQENQMHLVSHE